MGVLVAAIATTVGWGQVRFASRRVPVERTAGRVSAETPFRAVGVVGSAGGSRVRVSVDGGNWTSWQPMPESGLLYLVEPQRYFEYEDAPLGTEFLLIDPGVTPAGAVAAPAFVPREQWGCTASTCPLKAAPSYTTVTHLIVHHTDGANNATDWPAVVRSIWILHVQGNGWNDIGYNYLVDPNGVLYEGRAGGDGVLGAHFSGVNSGTMGVAVLGTYSNLPAAEPAIRTLREMLAWQAEKWHIDPLAQQLHASSGLVIDTISGHRDANLSSNASGATECPGNGLYTALAELRRDVYGLLAGACPVTLSTQNLCVPAEGGTARIDVIAPVACSWTASANSPWLAARADNETVSVDVQANGSSRRNGVVIVGGRTVAVVQAGAGQAPMPCPSVKGIVSAGIDTGRPAVAGSIASIYGTRLAPGVEAAGSGALPLTLAGVSVAIDGRASPLYFVSPDQINVQMPPATNIGSARAVVTVNGVASPELSFSVTEAVPAVFVAQNYDDAKQNGRETPVHAGSALVVYLTGGGKVDRAFPAAGAVTPELPLYSATLPWTATIGGRPAGLIFLGLAPGMTGVYQANLTVPADLAAGEYPLRITIAGAAGASVPIWVAQQ